MYHLIPSNIHTLFFFSVKLIILGIVPGCMVYYRASYKEYMHTTTALAIAIHVLS